MEELQDELGRAGDGNQNERIPAYAAILQRIIAERRFPDELAVYLDAVLQQSTGLVISRPLLADLVVVIDQMDDAEAKKEVCVLSLAKLQPRVVSFEEQDTAIREKLADIYEAENDNLSAARALQGMTLESGQRTISDEYKLKTYIRILRNLLQEDESVGADAYLNRATLLIHKTSDPDILIDFKLAQARIFDASRRFLEASSRYHELSFAQQVDPDERLLCLSAAIICASLAPAGPTRSRVLAILYKDDRSTSLPDFSILEKMYLDRVISPVEVENFAQRLKPHQMATLSDGSTVLSRAITEHNLLSASRLYNNIGFADLGELLNLSPTQAEEYAARMIQQRRMNGLIDQIDELIYFDEGAEDSGKEVRKWDTMITKINETVESCAAAVQA